jgi:hypothetical protein
VRGEIIQELVDRQLASPEQGARLLESAKRQRGNVLSLLVRSGIPADEVLEAACAATGFPRAPASWLQRPSAPFDVDVLTLCRSLGAAPIAIHAGKLCIAFSDPEVAVRAERLGLPAHEPYLALERDVEAASRALPASAGEFDDDDDAHTDARPLRTTAAPTRDLGAVEEDTDLGGASSFEGAKTVVSPAMAVALPAPRRGRDELAGA